MASLSMSHHSTTNTIKALLLRRNVAAGTGRSAPLCSALPSTSRNTNTNTYPPSVLFMTSKENNTSRPFSLFSPIGSVNGAFFTPMDCFTTYNKEDMTSADHLLDMEVDDVEEEEDGNEAAMSWAVWLSSTLKKRRTKMNKHKLKKRRKKLRKSSRR